MGMNLKIGSRGIEVKRLQRVLGIKADGIFGAKTAAALKVFQRMQNMGTDTTDNGSKRTYSAFSAMFSLGKLNYIKHGMEVIAPHRKILQLNTHAKLAVFMGQCRQEVGHNFTVIENLNYSCKALKMFSGYRGKPIQRMRDGRCAGHSANQERIGNIIYGSHRRDLGNVYKGDGYKYRGRGAGHLTGRANYRAAEKWVEDHIPEMADVFDIVNDPDAVTTTDLALFSFAVFWAMNNIGNKITGTDTKNANIATRIINRHTDSYEKRAKFVAQASALLKRK